jgi:hypothetical protein
VSVYGFVLYMSLLLLCRIEGVLFYAFGASGFVCPGLPTMAFFTFASWCFTFDPMLDNKPCFYVRSMLLLVLQFLSLLHQTVLYVLYLLVINLLGLKLLVPFINL